MSNISRFLRFLKICTWVVAGFLSFLVLMNLLWSYQVLAQSSLLLANIYAMALVLAVLGVIFFVVRSHQKYPAVMSPPKRVGPEHAGGRLRMARYTIRVADSLRRNPVLGDQLKAELNEVSRALAKHAAIRVESGELEKAQVRAQHSIDQALKRCDEIAEQRVRNATRDVMITVTLSPWRALDLALVLWRNMRMIADVMSVYNARPRAGEEMKVYRDVFMVVITVNFLNIGSRLLQNLATSLPLLGRFADDIAQGVGAGLMTSVTGHSAIARCRAFRGWNKEKETEILGRQLSKFAQDVSKMLFVDVWPKLKRPIDAKYAYEEKEAEEREIQEGIETALEETFGVMDSFIIGPTRAVGRGATNAGKAVGSLTATGTRTTISYANRFLDSSARALTSGAKWIGSTTRRAADSSGRAIKRAFQDTED